MQVKPAQFLQRYNSAVVWEKANPVLAAGELGVESDTLKVKAGDGVNAWVDLDYLADGGEETHYSAGRGLVLDKTNTLSAAIQYIVLRTYD